MAFMPAPIDGRGAAEQLNDLQQEAQIPGRASGQGRRDGLEVGIGGAEPTDVGVLKNDVDGGVEILRRRLVACSALNDSPAPRSAFLLAFGCAAVYRCIRIHG
jgi:hypothetical protein